MIQSLRRTVARLVGKAVLFVTLGAVQVDLTGEAHNNGAEKPPMTSSDVPDGRSTGGDDDRPDLAQFEVPRHPSVARSRQKEQQKSKRG